MLASADNARFGVHHQIVDTNHMTFFKHVTRNRNLN